MEFHDESFPLQRRKEIRARTTGGEQDVTSLSHEERRVERTIQGVKITSNTVLSRFFDF
jgi:hypothetical protein